VLVVSNISLKTNLPTIKPAAFLKSSIKDLILNINSDYRYLKTGYYVSMHAEVLGNKAIPSSNSIIDANRTPILLLKASKVGIQTLPYIVTDSVNQIISELAFPIVLFSVNPFSYDSYKTAKNRSALYRAVKSLSMNYKFAVCAQPLKGQMTTIKSIFGKTEANQNTSIIAKKVYETFKIPLCKLHIQQIGKEAFLCGLQPLKKEEITAQDLETISEEIREISKTGDQLVG